MCYCDRTQYLCGHPSVKYAFIHPEYENNPSDCPEHRVFSKFSTNFCQSCQVSGKRTKKSRDRDKDGDKDKDKGKGLHWPWGKKEDMKGKAVDNQTGQIEDKGKGKGKQNTVKFTEGEAESK